MRPSSLPRHLGWIFILAVILPGLLLAFIAVRSIDREEAFIEKQFQGTLLSEVIHLVSLVESELRRIEEELDASAPRSPPAEPGRGFEEWGESSPLVSSPFLLSPQFQILWPRSEEPLSEQELSFLRWNSDFLSNRLEIPVFENIALAFKDEVLLGDMVERGAEKKTAGLEQGAEKKTAGLERQQVMSQFEMSKAVQERVYEQAREEGQAPQSRIVLPSTTAAEKEQAPPSIFISRDLRLDEITADRERGLIPRFVEDRLVLLFWKKLEGGRILGCLLADEQLEERLISLLPDVYTSVRILTILDDRGRPLVAPEEERARDYRRPFVARELSALLPRWEAAAYLTDPQIVSSRAGRVAVILWVLVSILFVSILAGGILVLRTLRAEITLSRQKTTFVANVSHELKTPLTSIRLFAEMLREGRQPSPVRRREYLGLMVAETERLTRLINNVLDFSRMDREQKRYSFERLDAVGLCAQLVESQRLRCEQAGFNLELRPSLELHPSPAPGEAGEAALPGSGKPGALWVRADAESLKQALLNLLSNAEKYSEETKIIEIEIGQEGQWVWIDVMDRGSGIPASQTRHVFEEFYRGDDSLTARVRGSGLGLSITRRILSDHGGEVSYRPRQGGGSIFRIRLPLLEAEQWQTES